MWRAQELIFVLLILSVNCETTKNQHKIAIIGAGLSGVSAATKLIENGYTNIIIFEALDRKGGRIHTIDYGKNGQKLDLGGQWMHGELGNVIWEMVKDHENLGSSAFDSVDRTYLLSSGKLANQSECLKLQRLIDKILDDSWFEASKFNESFGHFFIDKFTKSLNKPAYRNISNKLALMMQEDVAHKRIQEFYGCFSWFDFSAKLNADYGLAGGDQDVTWRDKGYSTIFKYLAKELPCGSDIDSKIRFNKKVTSIEYSTKSGIKTLIKCADGTYFKADTVIVTIPLGVLKANHLKIFKPKLPKKKIMAIEKLGFGTLGKIFLGFKDPFWPLDESIFISYHFLWTEQDKQAITGTDKEWLLGIVNFSIVDAFSELIEALYAGPLMSTFETLLDQKIIEDSMWLLEKFLGKSLPSPVYMNRTKWLTNENFLGAYSFISYELEGSNVGPADLAEPISKSDGRNFLHFAGEATDTEFPSYAHGAVQSGFRVAREVMMSSKLHDEL